jgi:probable 2-oxoglutarate dehydrogenase E1 component DHKTD1
VISHIAISKKKVYLGTGCREKEINVSLLHNPSHLEAVNPVTLGKARAK